MTRKKHQLYQIDQMWTKTIFQEQRLSKKATAAAFFRTSLSLKLIAKDTPIFVQESFFGSFSSDSRSKMTEEHKSMTTMVQQIASGADSQ